ncbi:N-6 DNA methylase [uncultured Thermomonospora sp.]|uniref:N-6 DNA methylase n=1 Tax=uncultured Thermomonospora sp. TaxID=671175 RepID=UPI00259BF188|nr:N-6 DNA methylase [uncultured Thermomonospora sp.]
MRDRATVAASDIARLAGVGRAAVSNWRRRFPDFPAPVAGTSTSPLFSLAEVEAWLRRQGKLAEVPLEERIWQQLRAEAGDFGLGEAVARVGTYLAGGPTDGTLPDDLPELVDRNGPVTAFEFLCERYIETHSRRLSPPPAEAAALMAALAGVRDATVLDPACGFGTLLLAAAEAGAARLAGWEQDESWAAIAQARLRLRGHDGTVRPGDALRENGSGELPADAALCAPPLGVRDWGYEDVVGDPRWAYGLPPRGEPELAWIQHCLFHVRPGGRVLVLVPPAAAGRRSGRRIRARLLRTGALRAVIALPASAHLWVLRKPADGEPAPSHVLMLNMADAPWPQAHRQAVERWEAFQTDPETEGAVPIIDILDEAVDVNPGRYVTGHGGADRCFRSSLESVAELLTDLQETLTELRALRTGGTGFSTTTIAEQVKAGAITVLNAPKTQLGSGKLPTLTLEDVLEKRPPSGRSTPSTGMVALQPGDVVVPSGGRIFAVRLIDEDGALLGPGLQILRAAPDRLAPACLAGFIRIAALRHARSRTQTVPQRLDLQRIELPRLPLPDQHRLGEMFTRLQAFEDALAGLAESGSTLLEGALQGLGEGTLCVSS